MSRILVSGSIATDVIMNFHDQFGKYVLPEHTNALSVNFNIDHLVRHPWGAGHNIAYNLALLWEEPMLVGAAGYDFLPPATMVDRIDYSGTIFVDELPTAVAHIITDDANNQITAFYPGAILASTTQDLPEGDFKRAIISPNHPVTMLRHLEQAVERGMITFFDPGQPLSAFSAEQLRGVLAMGVYLIVNSYEKELFMKLVWLSFAEIVAACAGVIVTEGKDGSTLYTGDEVIHVDAFPIDAVVDPTGCGDAYRGGLLRGLHHGLSWEDAMVVGSYLWACCAQQEGTMSHVI